MVVSKMNCFTNIEIKLRATTEFRNLNTLKVQNYSRNTDFKLAEEKQVTFFNYQTGTNLIEALS